VVVYSSCSVTFYANSGYSGSSFTLYDGQRRDNLFDTGWNDQISSLRFFPDPNSVRRCVVYACWDVYCSGKEYGGSQDYIDDQAYVGNYANDKFSAVSVYSYDPTNDAYVMFYKSCAGTQDYSWFAPPIPQVNGFRSLFINDLSVNHIGNDALSRVVVSGRAAVQLYQDDYFSGANIIIAGPADVSCLTSTSSGNWNDQVSSAKIWDLTQGKGFPVPVGQWVMRTSAGANQPLSYSITYGYSTTDSTATSSTFGMQIQTSIEAGIDFKLGSAKSSVTTTYSIQIAQSVESSITKASSVTCSNTCAVGTCPAGGLVYLYSWEMSFSRPWDNAATTVLSSCNWVCRCSFTPPQCPLGACIDAQCNSCYNYH